jgi:uncharacterized protein YciI
MAFFIVTMSHPDGDGWDKHVGAHVDYLKLLVSEGKVRASGRLIRPPYRSGLIILTVADRAEADALIANDPFAKQGLINELSIQEWDPFFGVFSTESSRPEA